jgi:hypothetical protein
MQRIFSRTIASAFLVLSSSLARATDVIAPGFGADATHVYPASDIYTSLSNGNRVTFDGLHVALETDAGMPIGTLGSIAAQAFGSFLIVDPTSTYVLLGENTTGAIYKVAFSGGVTPIADLDYNYDAAFEDASHVLVSAATGLGNEIYRVDVNTGVTTHVVHANGYSGPIAVAANGDLYYCTQDDSSFPAPPGSSTILRWTNAAIHSGSVQTEGTASVFAAGLDGGSSMNFEHVFGHLFVCEAPFVGTNRILEFDPAGTRVDEVVTTANTLSKLEFFYGAGAASFQAFQPANVTMKYRSTDYNITFTSEIVTVTPKRPVATVSGPGLTGPGSVTFSVSGAQPNSSFFVIAGPIGLYNPIETAYNNGTYLFHTGIPYTSIRRTGINAATDANGAGSFTYYNPGSLQGTRILQALVRDEHGVFAGSSTAVSN